MVNSGRLVALVSVLVSVLLMPVLMTVFVSMLVSMLVSVATTSLKLLDESGRLAGDMRCDHGTKIFECGTVKTVQ